MPEVAPPDVSALLAGRRRILVTGGAGYGLRPTVPGASSVACNTVIRGVVWPNKAIHGCKEAKTRHKIALIGHRSIPEPIHRSNQGISDLRSRSSPCCSELP